MSRFDSQVHQAARSGAARALPTARNNSLHRARSDRGLTFWGQWLAAEAFLAALLIGLVVHKTGDFPSYYRTLLIVGVLASVPAYSLFGVFHKSHGYGAGIARLFCAWLVLLSGLTVVAYLTKTSELYSREVMLTWAIAGFLGQVALHLPLQALSRAYHQGRQRERTSLIIGTGELAVNLADKLVREHHQPMLGLVSPEADYEDDGLYPVVGNLAQLRQLIQLMDIRCLYIALPLAKAEDIESLYIDLLDANVDVIWMPDLNSLMLLNHSVSQIDGMPAIHLNESPLTSNPTSAFFKAVMDRSVAALALLMLSPLLAAVAIAVKLSSPGPVIFKQNRHGMNNQVIKVWKFRSMRVHDDKVVKQATREDPRITKVGKFIRRTSLDELPQFFNVLFGDMSLVGPRPHAVAHNDYYTDKISAYMARHRIKPGITGLAQVSGCRGETETIEKMARRVELDIAYINNWSVWLDVKILVKTPFTLFSKDIY